MNAKEKIAVIQAQEEGKEIQFRLKRGGYNERNPDYAQKYKYDWMSSHYGGHEFDFVSFEYRVAPKQVKLNSEYSATLEGDQVKVGCQTFPASKVLELAAMIQETKPEYVLASMDDIITKDFRHTDHGHTVNPSPASIGERVRDRLFGQTYNTTWFKPSR